MAIEENHKERIDLAITCVELSVDNLALLVELQMTLEEADWRELLKSIDEIRNHLKYASYQVTFDDIADLHKEPNSNLKIYAVNDDE